MFRRRRTRPRRRILRRLAFLSAVGSAVYAWRNQKMSGNDTTPPGPRA